MTEYDGDAATDNTGKTENARRLYAANKALNELEAQERARRRELETQLNAQLQAEFGDKIRTANIIRSEAQQRVDQDKVAAARVESALPEGTVMYKWKQNEDWRGHYGPYVLTGEKGVVEVWTEQSAHPLNQRYGLPNVGDVVVRILRKDGTPSAKLVRAVRAFSVRWVDAWRPEGVDPNKEKGA